MADYSGTSQTLASLDNSILWDFGGKHNISNKSELAMVEHSRYTADDAPVKKQSALL